MEKEAAMESFLGFKEPLPDDKSLTSLKRVPWISWDEWKFVKDSIFSSQPHCIASALRRISTWRSRGCNPVLVEVTASIIEIQQKDPFFRSDLDGSALQSEEMLAMLYCMAIMRLVNGVVEKTRKKNEISIGEAADTLGIPRILIDVRHEGSHRDLPSLQLVRLASQKALDWLISYYWEPQERAMPTQDNKSNYLMKDIKQRLHEVSHCLKAKKTKSSLSHAMETRARQTEHLFGRNKFLSPVAGMASSSNSTGYKKQLKKSLKNILRLYSSFSPEVVHVLLDFLLKELDSSNLTEHLENSQIDHSTEHKQASLHDWKRVVLKLSRKEPEFLFTLTQAVLERMETDEAIYCNADVRSSPESATGHRPIELLSYLFEWLVGNLKPLNLVPKGESEETRGSVSEKYLTKSTLMGLLRRCLLVSSPGNKQLMASAFILAQLLGDNSLLHKLKKLSFLDFSIPEADSSASGNITLLCREEDSVRQAMEKFESIRSQKIQNKHVKAKDGEKQPKSKWLVSKSWNPCPIGMLPHAIGFSGRLPILDNAAECIDVAKSSDAKEQWKLSRCRKREAERPVEELDDTPVKKFEADGVRYDVEDTNSEGFKGHLLIGGMWKKVGEKELHAIASAVRLLV